MTSTISATFLPFIEIFRRIIIIPSNLNSATPKKPSNEAFIKRKFDTWRDPINYISEFAQKLQTLASSDERDMAKKSTFVIWFGNEICVLNRSLF